MEIAEFQKVVALLADRSSAWQAYWTLFYTVSAAIVTLVASGKFLPGKRRLMSVLSALGFLVFASGNYRMISTIRMQREAIGEFIQGSYAQNEHVLMLVAASAPPSVAAFHAYYLGLCLFVVCLLCFIPGFQASAEGR